MMFDRNKLIARIREIETELIKLGVKPERVNFNTILDEFLVEHWREVEDQLATRVKWLERNKNIAK